MVLRQASSQFTNPDAAINEDLLPANSEWICLDQLHVHEGVGRGHTLKTPDDLVLGDEYRFPKLSGDALLRKIGGSNVTIGSIGQIPAPLCRPTLSYQLILMSATGQVIYGDLFLEGDGTNYISFNDVPSPETPYALISLTSGEPLR